MPANELDSATSRKLVALWEETGELLARIRMRELASQTPEESRQAAFDMLQMGGLLPADSRRERQSGLIEMQQKFARLRERGTA